MDTDNIKENDESLYPNNRVLEEKIQIKRNDDGTKILLLKGQPYMKWKIGDESAERIAIAQLYELGYATEAELSKTFEIHINSISKYIHLYGINGMDGLWKQMRGPKQSWKITADVRGKILYIALRENLRKYEEIQQRLEKTWDLKVSIESIRQVLKENGFVKESIINLNTSQEEFFISEEQLDLKMDFKNNDEKILLVETGIENELRDKNTESAETQKGLSFYSNSQRIYLDIWERGDYSAYGGGLLFVSLLQKYKFTSTIKKIVNIETTGGYSIEELIQTLFYFDIFGFRSIENFKTVYAEEFGILIGKLRSPSIFTLRRFLQDVSELEAGEKLIEEFAVEYLREGIAKWGIMYLDGHFLPYYGIYPVKMGWYTIRQKPFKGSYNFLSVDEKFNPWLFLVRSSEEDLLEKIPEMIVKAKEIGKEAGIEEDSLKNLIVVFDREGYSAELFRKLDEMKIFYITWAKYFDSWVYEIASDDFKKEVEINYEIQKSEKIKYYETERVMNKYGKIRTIVIESGSEKKRAAIYTNHNDKEAGEIIQIICRRWGEENLIKELLNKHMIDYSPGYEIEKLSEQPMVENPIIEELKKEKANFVSKINKLKIEIADNILDEKQPKNLEEMRKKEIDIKAEIAILNHQVFKINEKIEKLPKEVRYDEAHGGENLVKFNYERKRFLDCIKIFSYNMGKEMCRYISKYYDKKKEIWSALLMIIRRGAYVKLEGGKLRVILRRFKNPEIDFAARHLCEDLNQMKPITLDRLQLKIHYEVV